MKITSLNSVLLLWVLRKLIISLLGDAHCPRQNGVYPSEKPHECDVFYSCLNGVGSPTRCPEGLHYSEKEGICVWARDSGRYEESQFH